MKTFSGQKAYSSMCPGSGDDLTWCWSQPGSKFKATQGFKMLYTKCTIIYLFFLLATSKYSLLVFDEPEN